MGVIAVSLQRKLNIYLKDQLNMVIQSCSTGFLTRKMPVIVGFRRVCIRGPPITFSRIFDEGGEKDEQGILHKDKRSKDICY